MRTGEASLDLGTWSPHRPARREPRPELAVGLAQALWNDLRLPDHRHEVGVAVPTGDEVEVHVAQDARARGPAEVDADVRALRPHRSLDDVVREGEEVHDLEALVARELAREPDVPKRAHHDVPRVV